MANKLERLQLAEQQPYQRGVFDGAYDRAPVKTAQRFKAITERSLNIGQQIYRHEDQKGRTFDDWTLILGDIFNMSFLGIETTQAFAPSIGCPALTGISLGLGIVGGAINVIVGGICIKGAIQAFENKDFLLGVRLIIDGLFMAGVGIFMILVSISPYIAGLSGLAAVLAANPWILPTLFLVLTLPIFIEVSYRIGKIWCGVDIGEKLKTKQINEICEREGTPQEKAQAIIDLYRDERVTRTTPKDGGMFNVDYYERILRGEYTEQDHYDALRALLIQTLKARKAQRSLTREESTALNQLLSTGFEIGPFKSVGYKNYSPENMRFLNIMKNKFLPFARDFNLDEEANRRELIIAHKLLEKRGEIQAEAGVKVALDAFELFVNVLRIRTEEDPEASLARIQELVSNNKGSLRKKIRRWNWIQHIRLFQQLLYIAAFPVSLMALKTQNPTLTGAENGAGFSKLLATWIRHLLS